MPENKGGNAEPQLSRCGGEAQACPKKIGVARSGQWPAWVAALKRRWVVVVKAVSPKFLSRKETKWYVSQGYKLVKCSEVNPSLVSRGGERWRGQNRRQQAAGWEQFMANSHWLCHRHVLTACGAPWAKLTTASSFQGGPLVEVTPLSGAGDSSGTECGCIPGESSGAGQGLYPQDLLQGLNWGSSGAEDTGPEH